MARWRANPDGSELLPLRHGPAEKYRRPEMRFLHTMQTNEWCAFFKGHDFLIGISIDGPPEFHYDYRVEKTGRPLQRISRAIRLFTSD